MLRLILVSKSPRRHKILKDSSYKFTAFTVETSEFFDRNLSLNDALKAISRAKVEAFLKLNANIDLTNKLIMGCDTLVCMGERILGKPKDKNKAKSYLDLMSGQTHQVKTSVSIFDYTEKKWIDHIEATDVKMKSLNEKQINDYINTDEPYDKAGGYGIQGKGGELVDSYMGSWFNIVGFPIEAFDELVKKNNWDLK